MLGKWLVLGKNEFKYQMIFPIFTGLAIILSCLLVFGRGPLSLMAGEMIRDRLLPLSLAFSLALIFAPEERASVKESLCLSKTSFISFYFFRLVLRLLVLSLLWLGYYYLVKENIETSWYEIYFRVLSLGFFSASFGFLAYSLTLNESMALIFSTVWIFLSWFKVLGKIPFLAKIERLLYSSQGQWIFLIFSLCVFYWATKNYQGKMRK